MGDTVTDWNTAFQEQAAASMRGPLARPPATLGEVWKAEWNAAGLETLAGVHKPLHDAYDELEQRLAAATGKPVQDLVNERGLEFDTRGLAGRIDTLGKIVDSLPDAQGKALADYKDVYGRAKTKAAAISAEAEDVRSATYGLTAMTTGFMAGMARQMVDPVNLVMAPLGATAPAMGAGKVAVAKWLGKEFAIGAATQAVQEPYIAMRREELGLPTNTFTENVLQAGLGQAGLSALFRGAAVALRRLRGAGEALPPGMDVLPPDDFTAAAMKAERDVVIDGLAGRSPDAQEAVNRAAQAMNEGAPLTGLAPRHIAQAATLDGMQPIYRSEGAPLMARYMVVERAQLTASHDLDGNANPDFPQDLQPRDRTRDMSRLWVKDTAARLQPELLGAAQTAREGAPVVGPDGIVESGNGRVLALAMAYREHPDKAEAYRAFLDQQGFDIAGMKEPVLVRVRQTEFAAPEARKAFTDESNASATATLTPTEQAGKDARLIDGELLYLWRGGNLASAENAPFITRFIDRVVPGAERGDILTEGRALSKQGAERIQAALVAKGYGNDRLTQALFEERDPTSKAILNGLSEAAPMAARLRDALAEGRVDGQANVLPHLTDALELIDRARTSGDAPRTVFDQIDLERGEVPEATRAAGLLFFRNEDMTVAASKDSVARRVEWAVSKALLQEGEMLLGETLDAAALLKAARLADQDLSQLEMMRAQGEAMRADLRPAEGSRPGEGTVGRSADLQAGTRSSQPPGTGKVQQLADVRKLPADPKLDQARALVDEAGRDVPLHMDETAGGRPARQVLDEIDADRHAAAELSDCVERTGGRPPKEDA